MFREVSVVESREVLRLWLRGQEYVRPRVWPGSTGRRSDAM